MKLKLPQKIHKNREEGEGEFFWLARIYTPAFIKKAREVRLSSYLVGYLIFQI